jgi:transketolase
MLEHAKSGHSGGSLSAVEIIVALYFDVMRIDPSWAPDRDRFVLSKGHAAPCLYAVLANKGFFPESELMTLRQLHSRLQGHPDSKKLPGIEISTGSLGQGVSIATGMALAAKTQGRDVNVYTLVGDGESQEGLVWEAAEAAAHYHLDNLTVIIDQNRLQLDGPCATIMNVGSLAEKYKAFGFDVTEVTDGNDIKQVLAALHKPKVFGKPRCLVANTIKGKGVSFMENQTEWHGKAPNAEELEKALKELEMKK